MNQLLDTLHQKLHPTIRSKSDYVRSFLFFWMCFTLPITFTFLACILIAPSPAMTISDILLFLSILHGSFVLAAVATWLIEVKPKLKLRDPEHLASLGYVSIASENDTVVYSRTMYLGENKVISYIVLNHEGDIIEGPRFADAESTAWQQAALQQ